MIPFEEGFARIMALASPLGCETIKIETALNRVLAQDLIATRPQPALDISAMDGFALCGQHERYKLMGEIAAGASAVFALNDGEAARIFTGAPIPKGADKVLIQENAALEGEHVFAHPMPQIGANIRRAGQDFGVGFKIDNGQKLMPEMISLIAAMNFREIAVYKKPRVLILPTGSELVEPCRAQTPFDVIASNSYGLAALIEQIGGVATIAPILRDDLELITNKLSEFSDYDVIVTTGGASVGKYDFTAQAAQNAGFTIDLNKIAMRPGKPVIAGKRGEQIFLGLPGNPVSAMVTARIFLAGILHKLQGARATELRPMSARLKNDLPPNGDRTHLMRAKITTGPNGFEAEVFSNQDSALMSVLTKANGLVICAPHQPKMIMGTRVKFIWIIAV